MSMCVRCRAEEARKYGMLWFGAALSLAEIEAGMYCGGQRAALILGHLLGGVLLYFSGLLGGRLRRNGMECTRESFGSWGMRCLALANVLQLLGWTAVMLSQGANAAVWLVPGASFWSLAALLAALVVLWLYVGIRTVTWFASLALLLLLGLVILLSLRILALPPPDGTAAAPSSFWEAFELSLAMPLSWLPLIADYTKEARFPRLSCAVSALVYSGGSLWMYLLGSGLASLQVAGIAQGILQVGLGWLGLPIILISTVTTTCLDAYSAGESGKALLPRLPARAAAAGVCLLGAVLSVLGIMERYTDFLYLVSSLFAPMAVAMLTDQFLLRQRRPVRNLLAFLAGTAAYHGSLHLSCCRLAPSLVAIAVTFGVEVALAGVASWRCSRATVGGPGGRS